jgi:hypothetical protein
VVPLHNQIHGLMPEAMKTHRSLFRDEDITMESHPVLAHTDASAMDDMEESELLALQPPFDQMYHDETGLALRLAPLYIRGKFIPCHLSHDAVVMPAKRRITKAPTTMATNLAGAILPVDFGSTKINVWAIQEIYQLMEQKQIDLRIPDLNPAKKMES